MKAQTDETPETPHLDADATIAALEAMTDRLHRRCSDLWDELQDLKRAAESD